MHEMLLVAALSFAVSTDRPITASVQRVVAQEQSPKPDDGIVGFSDYTNAGREKFFGPANLLTGLALGASAAYDVNTTFRAAKLAGVHVIPQPNGSTRTVTVTVWERTAFYKNAVESGDRGGVILRKVAFNGVFWVGSHALRRSRSKPLKIVGWILPVALTGLQLKFGHDNARRAGEIEAMLR